MSFETEFDAKCRLLGEALRARQVPAEKRKACRDLLRLAYLSSSDSDETSETGVVPPKHIQESLDALLSDVLCVTNQQHFDRIHRRGEALYPVTIRSAVRMSFINRHQNTWTHLIDRLERVVDWFWDRCSPDEEEAGELSAEDRAKADLSTEDMEFVWGRRRRF